MKSIPRSKYKHSCRFWKDHTGKIIRFSDLSSKKHSKQEVGRHIITGKVMGIDNTCQYLRIRICDGSDRMSVKEHFRIPMAMYRLRVFDLEDEIIWKIENG